MNAGWECHAFTLLLAFVSGLELITAGSPVWQQQK
jgi:hypothetical protein